MKTLFEPAAQQEVKLRLAQLSPDSPRLWGKMNPAQAVAHCSLGFELAVGDRVPPRMFIGRIIGFIVKPMALKTDQALRRNSPTVTGLVVQDDRDFIKERERLYMMIDRFTSVGPQGRTAATHSFFGPMTPQEWGILMYKHLDHHLRQFGA